MTAAGRIFGTQLVLNLGGCNPDTLDNPDGLRNWVKELCAAIDMQPHGEPFLERFGRGDLLGWTLLQPITTSNIDVHCAPDFGNAAFVNIFSCRPFNIDTATDLTVRHFAATTVNVTVLSRHVPGGN